MSSDRLIYIKNAFEYAPAGEPGRGEEHVYWLIHEVDDLRAELTYLRSLVAEQEVLAR